MDKKTLVPLGGKGKLTCILLYVHKRKEHTKYGKQINHYGR